jgi:RimJ/RimL family protein N-acetyltransferase
MSYSFDYDVPSVTRFMQQYLPGLKVAPDAVVIGLVRWGRLVAGVLFEGFNGRNVWMHVAAEPGARWMVRPYLRACFAYPFLVAGVDRITGYVDASNQAARRFDEHLGFVQEARLSGAASDGGDVILYVMRRADCRFLEV